MLNSDEIEHGGEPKFCDHSLVNFMKKYEQRLEELCEKWIHDILHPRPRDVETAPERSLDTPFLSQAERKNIINGA